MLIRLTSILIGWRAPGGAGGGVARKTENRKLIVPETKITEVLQVLKDNKIDFMYDTRYSDKVDTGKLKVKAKATQTEIPAYLDDKPKTSKRKLSPEGS